MTISVESDQGNSSRTVTRPHRSNAIVAIPPIVPANPSHPQYRGTFFANQPCEWNGIKELKCQKRLSFTPPLIRRGSGAKYVKSVASKKENVPVATQQGNAILTFQTNFREFEHAPSEHSPRKNAESAPLPKYTSTATARLMQHRVQMTQQISIANIKSHTI